MVDVVVVVVLVAQPALPHASQQLGRLPTHAVPPLGGVQSAAPFLMLHLVWLTPSTSFVRQQATALALPQVDLAAHRVTGPLQARGKVPARAAALT